MTRNRSFPAQFIPNTIEKGGVNGSLALFDDEKALHLKDSLLHPLKFGEESIVDKTSEFPVKGVGCLEMVR